MSRLLLRSVRSSSAVAAIAAAASSSAACSWSTSRLEATIDDKPTFTERTVGSYENRLRKFSSPERVFEYFSSVKLDKEYYMTRDDLARAVTPYTYRHGAPIASKNPKFNAKASNTKCSKDISDEYLRRVQKLLIDNTNASVEEVKELLKFKEVKSVDFETHIKTLKTLQVTNAEFEQFVAMHGGPQRPKTFFDMVDADGDGLINYAEFMFLRTLLAIPERQFELAFKMFDTDDNGKLDHREFKQIMALMRLRTPAGRQDRRLHDDEVPIFQHLFGKFATKSLSYDDFCSFRLQLKQEIMRIQFEQYDVDGNKTLSPREFGMFLVSHVDQRHIEKWIERVDLLLHLSGCITEQEFMDFNIFLEHLDELKVAMDLVMQAHGVNKEQFQRATRAAVRASKNTRPVTPLLIDILFTLFDLNGDGYLSTKEFIEVMQTRKDSGLTEVVNFKPSFGNISWKLSCKICARQPRDTGAFHFLQRIKQCIDSIS